MISFLQLSLLSIEWIEWIEWISFSEQIISRRLRSTIQSIELRVHHDNIWIISAHCCWHETRHITRETTQESRIKSISSFATSSLYHDWNQPAVPMRKISTMCLSSRQKIFNTSLTCGRLRFMHYLLDYLTTPRTAQSPVTATFLELLLSRIAT